MLQVVQWVLVELQILGLLTEKSAVEFKISLDGRLFWGRGQVMVGIVCCDDATHYGTQRPNRVFPLAILNRDEDYTLLSKVIQPVLQEKDQLETEGVQVGEEKTVHPHFKCTSKYLNILLIYNSGGRL